MKMDGGRLAGGAALLGCSEDSTGLYWFSVNSLIQFHYLKLLCKGEHTACLPWSSEEKLPKALGNHSKHSPSTPVRGKAGLQSEGVSLGPGVPGRGQSLAAALCCCLAISTANQSRGWEDQTVPDLQKSPLCSCGWLCLSAVHKNPVALHSF